MISEIYRSWKSEKFVDFRSGSMTSTRAILFIINMANQLREEFSDADLLYSLSSFEESSGMSDVEDETGDVLFHPIISGVQPYQFEPERLEESTSTNS